MRMPVMPCPASVRPARMPSTSASSDAPVVSTYAALPPGPDGPAHTCLKWLSDPLTAATRPPTSASAW